MYLYGMQMFFIMYYFPKCHVYYIHTISHCFFSYLYLFLNCLNCMLICYFLGINKVNVNVAYSWRKESVSRLDESRGRSLAEGG